MPLTTDTQTFAVSKENAFTVICVVLCLDEDFIRPFKKVIDSLDFYSTSLFHQSVIHIIIYVINQNLIQNRR